MAKMEELEGRRFEDPVKSFNKKVGWLSKYLKFTIDGDGLMRLSYRNNAMTFFRNKAGMFVMITPRMDWKTVMTSYDARNNVEMAFDIFKSELDGKRGRTGDPVRTRAHLFIKFLTLMICVGMQSVVSRSDIKGLTVENMLLSAGTYTRSSMTGVYVPNVPSACVRYSHSSEWTIRINCPSRTHQNDVAQSREFRLICSAQRNLATVKNSSFRIHQQTLLLKSGFYKLPNSR